MIKPFILSIIGILLLVNSAFAASVYLNPDSTVTTSDWQASDCRISSAFKCVDDGFCPNTADYVYDHVVAEADVFPGTGPGGLLNGAKSISYIMFGFEDLPERAKSVNYVTVFYYAREYGSHNYKFNPALSIGGNIADGSTKETNDRFRFYSQLYRANPVTGEKWTVDEVNALVAGASVAGPDSGVKLSQMDIYVSYNTR